MKNTISSLSFTGLTGSQTEERKKCLLDQTELFVIDMDGTFYCGEKMIDGALDFLKAVVKRGKQFLFSQTTRQGRRKST